MFTFLKYDDDGGFSYHEYVISLSKTIAMKSQEALYEHMMLSVIRSARL